MKIAILFTLIGLSLCQDGTTSEKSCPNDDCSKKIEELPKEKLDTLVSALCDVKSLDDVTTKTKEQVDCVECNSGDSKALVKALKDRLEKEDLNDSKCSGDLVKKLNDLLNNALGSAGGGAGGLLSAGGTESKSLVEGILNPLLGGGN
ncbi:uncharacterized protein [Hyperolius riggenbachi]|uniref:uncharacterized protein isoform X3 n=1 Tax=Hyperolius riggenbachi TaxID=752182 RepID=UPI0035A39FA0